jgi:ABC-type thiamine transport system substrate-binding protein
MHNQIICKNRITGQLDIVYNKYNFSPDEIWCYWEEMTNQVRVNYVNGWNNSNTEHSYSEFYLCHDTTILDKCLQYCE